ncbi:MAG TPA: NADP-dependent oxidoreductase [Allosphingosinicella sp.]|nr:NADP-dependent oxidoreductase [Allosphingosinicella sp.]
MARKAELPPYGLPAKNRSVLLVRRPEAIPQPCDFELADSAVPDPGEGRFLVRNLFLSVDPAQRGWAADVANYSSPVPLGTPMRALAVGIVVSSRCDGVAEGDLLYGWFGWQYYCVAGPDQILLRGIFDVPLTAYLGLLGINGMTAYLALTEIGRPEAGETLLVSTAAGAVGSFVGQIGKLRGCTTIGLTGSAAKVARCEQSYRYDMAINYKDEDWQDRLAEALPNGADIYFDNTGGPILDAALRRMAVGGRIVQCGTASIATWNPPPQGPRNEREILTRRLQWGGFVIFDHLARFQEAAERLCAWYNEGAIICDEDISVGIDQAPGSIADIYAGRNSGKKMIDVTCPDGQ